jgi:phosphoribosylformylglycinamidine synthase
MKSAVIVFPGSNCDRDIAVALERVTGARPHMVWHAETELPPGLDLVVLPGGFSYGDYLRAGAMAARAPVMSAVRAHAERGGLTLGVCNGFQVLCETGLLPGALMRNAGLRFICRETPIEVANQQTRFTSAYGESREIALPIAHADGRYFADEETLDRIEGEGRVVLRYRDNPNGSARGIAGLMDASGRIMGMMPHPERSADPTLGRTDGWAIFQSLADAA